MMLWALSKVNLGVSIRLIAFSIAMSSSLNPAFAQSCDQQLNICKANAVSDEQDCIANAGGAAQRHQCVVDYNNALDACTAEYNQCSQVTGYVDPKYVVVGVTYAPPGNASSVTYSNSTTLATENSLANTFTTSHMYGTTLKYDNKIPAFQYSVQVGYSYTATQTTKDSQSVKLSWSTGNWVQTYGVPDSFAPVNHDYDVVYVWLNPVEIFSVWTQL